MSKQKGSPNSKSGAKAGAAQPKPAPKKNNTTMLTIGIFAVVAVILGIVVTGGKFGGKGKSPEPTAEEKKYIGRLLPAGYEAPKVAEPTEVQGTMVDITATQDDKGVTLPVSDVTTNKIVRFQYTKADGQAMPLIAYVRPSGKLFVGVSYCIPCQGTGQRLEADGTLTCESCGTKRDPETQVGISGACRLYPLDELPVTVAGDKITIDKAALDGWTQQPTDRKVGA